MTEKEFALTGDQIPAAERELLEGCRQGSLASFERLYEEHGARMKSIALNLLGSVADAEDAVQETFLKVYRGLSRFRGGSSLSTWVYRILVNSCYDLMRRNRRRAEGPLPAKIALASGSQTDHPMRLAIETALRRLDPRERAAFLLCEVEGFSHREAGEILDVSENASRTLLFRARRQMQQDLRAGGAFVPEAAS
ncbi:MAG: RNA polymerase sigma factor [Acidobacteriota bacterium]